MPQRQIILFLLAVFTVAEKPEPEPPQPHIPAGFDTYNVFWPYDVDANGTVYACTYMPTLVLANHTRLIAHGSCALKEENCNGLHLASRTQVLEDSPNGNPIFEGLLCQKYSDDGGRTWSQVRLVLRSSQNGQIVWDDYRKVLVAHWTPGTGLPGTGIPLQEYKSWDLGATWSPPRSLSFLFEEGPEGDGSHSLWASPSAALQLSPTNKYHPNRLVFAGRMNGCGTFWYTDDGETYHMSKNVSGAPFCEPGIMETALAETPDGGILTSSRNSMFHGPGKCNCRATTHSVDGGTTFGPLGFDRVLVEPECMASMVNDGDPGAIFHANPGRGTNAESKSAPNGRASGTVRRSEDGGMTWTSVLLNGHDAYSYSSLSKMPTMGFVGLAWETVLPGSNVPKAWSTNNVVFTRIPTNFTAADTVTSVIV